MSDGPDNGGDQLGTLGLTKAVLDSYCSKVGFLSGEEIENPEDSFNAYFLYQKPEAKL
jgi:hypothetical protein